MPSTILLPVRVRQHWPAFDALRGLAMLLGVVLHAAVSYMPHTMPNLVWAVHDDATNPLFDWVFWSIHGFRLPLFFTVAGFFSVTLCKSRGTSGYLQHRSRRLLVPLLCAGMIILPLTFGVWTCGWLRSGLCTWNEIRRMRFTSMLQANLYGPAHLWFLEYLYVMCLLFAGTYWLRDRAGRKESLRIGDWRDCWLDSKLLPLVPAVPAALVVWLSPGTICDFHNSFVPEPARLIYYGIFFVMGVWLARAARRLDSCLGPRSIVYLALCLPLLLANGLLVQQHLEHRLGGLGQVALGTTCALMASLAVFGLMGLALRYCTRERPWLLYLANASYWIYLVHLPLVGLAQVLLARVAWPAEVKFAVVTAVVLAIGLGSYHRFVRFTFLGRFLNGTTPTKALPPTPRQSVAA